MSVKFSEKVEGAIYGLAIGDGMGAPVEGWSPEKIAERFNDVKEFLPVTHEGDPSFGKGKGRITDDTLMTEALIRAYMKHEDHLDAYDYKEFLIPEIAQTKVWVPEWQRTMPILERLWWPEKYPWLRLMVNNAEPRSAGIGNLVNCGAAMYMMPVGAVNAGDPSAAYQEAAAFTLAHNESYAVEAAAVQAAACASAFRKNSSIEDVLSTALEAARDGTKSAIRSVLHSPGKIDSLKLFILKTREAVALWDRKVGHFSNEIRLQPTDPKNVGRPSRAASIEELPVALAALKYGAGDFIKTTRAAIFYGRDCDSIAGMAGALFGAIYGVNRVPEHLRRASDKENRRNFKNLAAKFTKTTERILDKDATRFNCRQKSIR